MDEVLPLWTDRVSPQSIIALSADPQEMSALRGMFPNARIEQVGKEGWNLDELFEGQWDLAWTAFTFMCAAEPRKWIDNILVSCQNVWIMDLVEGWRGGPDGAECATNDYDVMRYHLPGHRAVWHAAFDLGSYGDQLKDYRVYSSDNKSRTFIAWISR